MVYYMAGAWPLADVVGTAWFILTRLNAYWNANCRKWQYMSPECQLETVMELLLGATLGS